VCAPAETDQDLPKFELNLSPSILELLAEAKYVSSFDINIPDNARPVLQVSNRVLSLL
jgi:hypothetical protein